MLKKTLLESAVIFEWKVILRSESLITTMVVDSFLCSVDFHCIHHNFLILSLVGLFPVLGCYE